jgi:hypothetical protein
MVIFRNTRQFPFWVVMIIPVLAYFTSFCTFPLEIMSGRLSPSDMWLSVSSQRGLAHSGISTSFVTMEQLVQQRYQFHCALLLDVPLLKYLDDDSNLRSTPLL